MDVRKVHLHFNVKIDKQKEGASIGSTLETLLANILMTELEKDIIQKLVNKTFIKFYTRYVDATLLLVKDEDIDPIFKELNSHNKSIKLLTDGFTNEDVNFLDIKIHQNNTDIFH